MIPIAYDFFSRKDSCQIFGFTLTKANADFDKETFVTVEAFAFHLAKKEDVINSLTFPIFVKASIVLLILPKIHK